MSTAVAEDTGLQAEISERDQLDTGRLSAWMKAHVAEFEGPLSYAKFAGGQSNPTYKLMTPARNYVLRRKPMGDLLPSAHQVDREYRVMAALHPTGFPVPRQYGLCEDDGVIGSAFYVMEMVEGRTIWDGSFPGMDAETRRAHYHAMIDTLADLHNVDLKATNLEDFGRPGNYFERQVSRWTKQYRGAETEHMPAMERLIEWLPRTIPEQTRTSIVHGDYRCDNMKFAPGLEPRVAAVLDWELCTTGDPLADLSYFLISWVTQPEGRSGVMGLTGRETGIPTLEEVVARYCERTGRDSVPDLNWLLAFNLFRLASIVQGIRKRFLIGTASSANAEATSARVPMLADAAWDFAVKAGA
ncbi:phosphotransferase family protein [Sphingomonas sp.]|jgi:aminoglycoside phosphotransferase (APT) family kinase protein|uniref:phosphotransferase family protein n=1 Tax=Sphingomonas sp. TaxID=28214 RepID=UPI002630F5F4|nr:phosphotransferase family protein [Sphingomonas sp.]MDF2495138.1 phosphotransferase family protein [Sphingomonas sp.]